MSTDMIPIGAFLGYTNRGKFVFVKNDLPDTSETALHVGGFVLPVQPPASDWYIAQFHKPLHHSGLDINLNKPPYGDVELGEPVFATCNGLVVFAGMARGNSWGNLVITASIDDGQLLFWRYAHLEEVAVEAGQVIKAGVQVGTIGKGYGGRYAAHLHLDCWRGYMLQPEAWLTTRVDWLDPLKLWEEWGAVFQWGRR